MAETNIQTILSQSPQGSGTEMYQLISELFPICRSITGNGVRQTLRLIQQHVSLQVHEVPTGTKVLDWTVPREWNVEDAYVRNSAGEKVIDFRRSNLHLLNYSTPIRQTMPLSELKQHLFSIPDRPDWIPYRTSYYKDNWGFCLSHNDLEQLKGGQYEVVIDSTLTNGHLTYGEYFLPGESSDEVLIYTHICHPSMGNDNLSGLSLSVMLAKALTPLSRRYSYRFLFCPGTIGSITWLARNETKIANIKHGLVLTGVGDSGPVTYKKSRRGNAEIDRAMTHALKYSGENHTIIEFFPYGYDERQFCSPGFNLPVGSFMRTPHSQYPEYHTSADNLDFVQPASLGESFHHCVTVFNILEHNRTYLNQNPKGEPQLGRRGLYRAVAGQQGTYSRELSLLWVLNLSDGFHSLLDIADRAGVPFEEIQAAAQALLEHGLLKEVTEVGGDSGDKGHEP
jgi:aminopeptidase-like protein